MGLNSTSRGYNESICPGGFIGLLSRTQDEVWNFFEKLAWDTYVLTKLKIILDTHLMTSLFFLLVLILRIIFYIHMPHLSLLCLLFFVIIVSHLL